MGNGQIEFKLLVGVYQGLGHVRDGLLQLWGVVGLSLKLSGVDKGALGAVLEQYGCTGDSFGDTYGQS